MSGENVDIVRTHMAAYLSGDYERALAAYSPEVVCDVSVRPEGRIYRGREGVAEAFRVWRGTWESWTGEIEEVTDAGDRVLMVLRESGRGKGSGVEVEQRTFFVYTLHEGMITRAEVLISEDRALEAAGLSE